MDGDDIARALADGLLAGREVREIAIPNQDGVAFVIDIDHTEVVPAWTAARAAAERIGRWPVVVNDWDGPVREGIFGHPSLWEGRPPLAELVRAARATSFEDALAAYPPWEEDAHWEQMLPHTLDETRKRVGDAPTVEAVADTRPSSVALERRLMEWERERGAGDRPEHDLYLDWFDPGDDGGCAVLLPPVAASEEVILVHEFFGAEGAEASVALAAIMRTWRERYGAELVAHWGTMLQLVVARPPANLEDAFELAVQQDAVAGSTLPGPGISLREHARALVGRDRWFLHDRP